MNDMNDEPLVNTI